MSSTDRRWTWTEVGESLARKTEDRLEAAIRVEAERGIAEIEAYLEETAS